MPPTALDAFALRSRFGAEPSLLPFAVPKGNISAAMPLAPALTVSFRPDFAIPAGEKP